MTEATTQTKVVIFGSTGAIGTGVAQILAKEHPNWSVQAVTRDTSKASRLSALSLSNVTMVQGDPLDAASVSTLCQDDVDLVFCCVGFAKYEAKYWKKHWPLVTQNLLAANVQANNNNNDNNPKQQRQRMIFCDNLYMYGAGHDEPITTSTPIVEASLTKGKPNVRSWMRQQFEAHMKDHPGTLTVVGGADFFGPHVTNSSFLGDTLTGKLVAGETPLAVGAVTPIHDFCYAPDFAKALATVATRDEAYDRFWICPHTIHDKSLQHIANDIQAKLQPPEDPPTKKVQNVSFSVLNKWLLYGLSPFMSFAYEMLEMLPFWTEDYRIGGDTEFTQTFGVTATDYDTALQELVDFYKDLQQTKNDPAAAATTSSGCC